MSYDQDEIELTPEQLAQLQHSDTDIICDAAGIPRIAWTAVGVWCDGYTVCFTFNTPCHGLGPALGHLDAEHGLVVGRDTPQREVTVHFELNHESREFDAYEAWVSDNTTMLVTHLQSCDGVPVTRLRREWLEDWDKRIDLVCNTESWDAAMRVLGCLRRKRQ